MTIREERYTDRETAADMPTIMGRANATADLRRAYQNLVAAVRDSIEVARLDDGQLRLRDALQRHDAAARIVGELGAGGL